MDSSKLTRICVQRVLPHEHDYHESIKHDDKLSAAFWRGKLWPQNSTVTISFLDDPTSENTRTPMSALTKIGRNIDPLQEKLTNTPLKEALKIIIKERIQPLVNLKLKFIQDKDTNADIRITFKDPNASWSLVGTDAIHESAKSGCSDENSLSNCASMNLGWFDVGTYIHEFGHALGMIHEHQNTSHGGTPIKWNKPKLYSYMENTQGWDKEQVDTNVIGKYKSDQLNGSKFDPLSVMLYFFPPSLTTNGIGTKQNFSLSGIDAEWINKSYPGSEQDPKTFYMKAYGKSLDSSIQNSSNLRSKMSKDEKEKTKSHTKMWIFISIGILLFLVILSLILWLTLRNKNT